MEHSPEALESALAGRYRLEREIGRGGMAIVFLAADLRHDRRVAIKVMRPEVAISLGRERFLREIHIAAGLSHPNILPLHDSGEAGGVLFYVMPYVDGESLRERIVRERKMSLEGALLIAREVSDALGHAHRQGVVHRDIKPENILLSSGHALVADFGIARALHAARGGTTETGVALGTPTYMSPEQIAGNELDGRSDVYSLGCVLYEMLAGLPPFAGPPEAVMARHLMDPAPPVRTLRPDLPAWVDPVVARALAKVPADRFADAAALAAALSPSSATIEIATRPVAMYAMAGGNSIGSLVVLPLENLSRDAAEEYFADGMTEALITDLAKIRALRVISRSSAMRYKGAHKSLPEIGRELNVDGVIEGAVMRSGGRVRITAQLVHAATDTHLWAERYERQMSDVLDLQSELAQTIAAEVRVQLTPDERERFQRTQRVDPAALEDYLKGRFHWAKRTDAGFTAAIAHFRRAIGRDPRYAPAYTGLADTLILLGEYGNIPPAEAFPPARAAALEALAIDDGLAEAHNSLAYVKHLHEWDWQGAEREFRRAIELNPNYALAHHWYARNLLTQQRWDDAARELDAALERDPLSLVLHADYGYHGIATRNPGRAIERLRMTLEMDPNFPLAHFYLGLSYVLQKEFDAALGEFHKARAYLGEALSIAAAAYAQGAAGRRSDALATLAELQEFSRRRYVAPYLFAIVQLGLGDHERTFEHLEQAFRERHNWLVRLPWEPYLDPLRADPRFVDLMRRVGFPQPARSLAATD